MNLIVRQVTAQSGKLAVLVAVLLMAATAAAQSTATPEGPVGPQAGAAAANVTNCGAFAAQDASLELISKLCGFALTYGHRLPDFIVQQSTTSRGPLSTVVISAQVTYRGGLEHYSQVTINGKPLAQNAHAGADLRLFTSGEFGPLLVNLFEVPGAVEFKFRKTETLNGVPAAVYEFRLPKKKNTFWALRGPRGQLKPEFHGQLWLEPTDGYPLREEVAPVNLEPMDMIAAATFLTDYAMTAVKDAGTFLLPVKSESTVCLGYNGTRESCTTNVVAFHDYQKFVATSRIVPANSQP